MRCKHLQSVSQWSTQRIRKFHVSRVNRLTLYNLIVDDSSGELEVADELVLTEQDS